MELTEVVTDLLLETAKVRKRQCPSAVYGADGASLRQRRPANRRTGVGLES